MKLRFSIVLILLVSLIGGAASPHAFASANAAYVEPALLTAAAGDVSIIVAADSSAMAASAVQRAGGHATSDLWLIDSVAATLSANQIAALAAMPGIRSIVANRGIKTSDASVPDVQPTKNKKVWKLAYPVTIDIGADNIQNQGIDGSGVTVALVDSGVYFDKEVRRELGNVVEKHFLGQIDFVENTCRTQTIGDHPVAIGTQYNGYCALTSRDSADAYGHGTAVASIIWNNFTDYDTGVMLGVAPSADVLSVRVLGDDGQGSYETVVKGIQYVVQNKLAYHIRVLNLSLSAQATTPYFVDPLNRAVERAWASGIVVLAAAGNTGGAAQTVTVPGNDPYVITVGAVNGNRTAGDWTDDSLPPWSSTGPTSDGFAKPDLLAPGANLITFMYNGGSTDPDTQKLVLMHPDFSETASLFRMSGTSMSTAVASGVAALMLQAHPQLTPDQVKFRLMYSARAALTDHGDPTYNVFQQGMGRIWAPDAVLGSFPVDGAANVGMNLGADLAHGYQTDDDLAYHYQGPIRRMLSDDGGTYLYYVQDDSGQVFGLGAALADGMTWLKLDALANGRTSWNDGRIVWGSGMIWAGGMALSGGTVVPGGMIWAGKMIWAGGMIWAGSGVVSGGPAWAQGINTSATQIAATAWVTQR